jgi:FAD synthase
LPGVYVGLAFLEGIQYKSVLSIGYNPYFLDVPLSIEVHLYKEFEEDFYGKRLNLIITHFLRPESDFRSFGKLYN